MRKKLDISPLTKNIDQIADENRDPNIITQIRRYRLITPLFGGGIEAGINDEITPISGKAIRGQLRFWWRATRGTGTLTDVRKREEEIWGAASTKKRKKPSKVSVEVNVINSHTSDAPYYLNQNNSPRQRAESIVPHYAAFPLQPTNEEIREAQRSGERLEVKKVRVGVEFELAISFHSGNQKEVQAALWAWETFGGVGGRTRRGFGAVELVWAKERGTEVTPEKIKATEAKSKIREQLSVEGENGGILAGGAWDPNVPHLSATVDFEVRRSYTGTNRHINAWKFLIQSLQAFRQSRKPSRSKPQGQSHWPEPDKIRRMVGSRNFYHPVVHSVQTFPRAHFGLPIIFHFNRDEMRNDRKFDVELKPVNHKRLASPLLLRPIACANDETIALALILDTPPIPADWVELAGSSGTTYGTVDTDLNLTDISQIKPMLDLDPSETSVLKSFLKKIR